MSSAASAATPFALVAVRISDQNIVRMALLQSVPHLVAVNVKVQLVESLLVLRQ